MVKTRASKVIGKKLIVCDSSSKMEEYPKARKEVENMVEKKKGEEYGKR